jgi:hypothetical protein
MMGENLELAQKRKAKLKRGRRAGAADPDQFALELQPNVLKQIIIVAMDEIDGAHLRQLIQSAQPMCLRDLRHGVRVANPGSSREHFFNYLSKTRSLYSRDPIAWHSIDMAPLAVDASLLPPRVRYEVIEQQDNNVVLLVAKPTESRKLASVLNFALSQKSTGNWAIQMA